MTHKLENSVTIVNVIKDFIKVVSAVLAQIKYVNNQLDEKLSKMNENQKHNHSLKHVINTWLKTQLSFC